VTAEFEHLAHTMAANAGRAGLRVHVLPYPLEARPEEEVRTIARDHWPKLLVTIEATAGSKAADKAGDEAGEVNG
jgi:hypothetical protein